MDTKTLVTHLPVDQAMKMGNNIFFRVWDDLYPNYEDDQFNDYIGEEHPMLHKIVK